MLVWIVAIFGMTRVIYGVSPDGTDYCGSQFACKGVPHLRCQYKKQTGSKWCSSTAVDTTPEARKVLLHWMNKHRSQTTLGESGVFNQTVSNMRQLTWDHKLEEFALVAGTQCVNPLTFKQVFSHPCAGTTEFVEGTRAVHFSVDHFKDINKFISELKKIEIPDDVIGEYSTEAELWETPVEDFLVHESQSPFDPRGYPSHTAVLWANSHKLGCSIVSCDCHLFGLLTLTTHVVCYFGPEPNIVGQPVFLRGRPCSNCPAGTACKSTSAYPKLCAKPSDPHRAEKIEDIGLHSKEKEITLDRPAQRQLEGNHMKSAKRSSATLYMAAYFHACVPLMVRGVW